MGSTIGRALVLLGAGVALGFAANAVRPDGVALQSFAAPNTCGVGGEEADQGTPIELFSAREAEALCADPLALVADARSAEAYAEGHVAGAIHLPCSATEQAAAAAEHDLREKQLLLVVGERTDDAYRVAEQMRGRLSLAKLRIAVLEGGFEAWAAAGLACASGECPACGGAHSGETHP